MEMKRQLRRHEKWLKRQGRGMAAAKRIFTTTAIFLVIGLASCLAIAVPVAHAAAPTIDTVSPSAGNWGDNLAFTITGSGFGGGVTVSFGAGITVNVGTYNDYQITGNIIIASGTACGPRNVYVTTSGGTGTKTNGFTVRGIPSVTSVSPNTGDQGQTNLSVIINGSCLTDANDLDFYVEDPANPGTWIFDSKITATILAVNSSSQITASISIATDAASGARRVLVTTPAGTGSSLNVFTVEIPPPTVTSISPNSVYRDQTKYVNIYGKYFTGVSAVSFGSGVTVSQFGAMSDAWIIAKVSVSASATTGLRDVSVITTPVGGGGGVGTLPGGFNIPAEGPIIKIVSPNGGEKWEIGTEQTINWTSTSGLTGKVKIELSTGGSTWRTLFSATENDGIQKWKVDKGPSNAAMIRVSTITYPQVSDTSDVAFALTSPTITVISPNGGDKWEIGSEQTITWKSSAGVPGSKVKIELSTDGGSNWKTIISSTPNDGTAIWKVAGKPTNQARIKVLSTSNKDIYDMSDASFALAWAIINIISPNGGQDWNIGTAQTIVWTSSPSLKDKVKIQLSTDGGSNWKTIISSTPNDGTEIWKVSGKPTYQARIKVLSVSNKAIYDISDASFTIR
jgi:hypothetical protein